MKRNYILTLLFSAVTIISVAQNTDSAGSTSANNSEIYSDNSANASPNPTTTINNSNGPEGMYDSDDASRNGMGKGWIGLIGLLGLLGLLGKRKSA